jgi:putative transposase
MTGAIYHITSHAVDGAPIVRTDVDRSSLLEVTASTVERQRWECFAFCVMDTHYHLLVATLEPNLAQGMQRLNSVYAQGFNRRHGRRGHLFRERYHAGHVLTDAHLALSVRYIARNPVVVDLARSADTYRWSSYPGVVGSAPCWPFVARPQVLELFGPEQQAVRLLREFVEGPAHLAAERS